MSKIKCFNFHEFGHYYTKCPHKNSSKKTSGGVTYEALASQFDLHFTLITCMSNTMMGSLWYLDSGASFHMTWCRDFLSVMKEKDLHLHIKLGDDGRYNMIKIGTFTFQRESSSPLRLKDVMFIPGDLKWSKLGMLC